MKNGNMSKFYSFAVISLMVIAPVVSCTKERALEAVPVQSVRQISIEATVQDETTRTAIVEGGAEVFWQQGDAIKLFRGSSESKCVSALAGLSKAATFTGPEPEGSGDFIGLYPYSETASYNGSTVAVTLPSSQVAKEGSFAQNTLITLGKTSSTAMTFFPVCGGLRFTISQSGIKRITFEAIGGEAIAGGARIKFSDGIPGLDNVTGGLSCISLAAPDGSYFQPGIWYYFVFLPTTLSKGYRLSFYRDDAWASKEYADQVSVKRGTFGSKQNIDDGVEFTAFSAYESVDLGLSVKWATCNVGATSPEMMGDHFAWGETKEKDLAYQWSTYKWGSSPTKYNSTDNIWRLDPEDDAATVNWGEGWRMPTANEQYELHDNCSWKRDYLNGVPGYYVTSKKTGYTDRTIFLPCGGWKCSSYVNETDRGFYWCATRNTATKSIMLGLEVSSVEDYQTERYRGLSVRPVSNECLKVAITGIELNRSTIFINVGGAYSLKANVTTAGAGSKSVSWSSSNPEIASVDSDGRVTAHTCGKVVVTATTEYGGLSASCDVITTQDGVPYEAVDLGLSVKWAAFNIGATSPEETGDLFAWGETSPKSSYGYWVNYKWGTIDNLTKYNVDSKRGTVDNITVLEPADDAAHVNWGGKWRMPTKEEIQELIDNCDWEEIEVNGVACIKMTGKKEGYTGKSLFFSVVDYDPLSSPGPAIWSSSLYQLSPFAAYNLGGGGWGLLGPQQRYKGLPVRPVMDY